MNQPLLVRLDSRFGVPCAVPSTAGTDGSIHAPRSDVQTQKLLSPIEMALLLIPSSTIHHPPFEDCDTYIIREIMLSEVTQDLISSVPIAQYDCVVLWKTSIT